MVAQSNAQVDNQQWFANSGANAHITNELENLNNLQPFQSDDTVAIGNGAGFIIENTDSSFLHSSSNSVSKFQLKNVLHCPKGHLQCFFTWLPWRRGDHGTTSRVFRQESSKLCVQVPQIC
jgi:hypothetical protein